MSLGLATKGIIALGGGGGGGGQPYPVYIEKVGDVTVSAEMEEDILVSLDIEDVSLEFNLDSEQEITSDADSELDVQIEVTDDGLGIEVE